jgi:membrane-associated phospholipid phosphatase
MGVGAAGALAAHQWDAEIIEDSREHLRPRLFDAGNVGGGFLVQASASLGLYSIAKLAGSNALAALGADLTRAQILTQGVVQTAKFASHRSRPDGSDRYSLPSGHTASAFATATILQRRFGWKVGLAAYGFGAYVATSRLSANKHHLSDVLFGAAIGVAAGRTVTVGRGKAQFNLGVTPTLGGAAIVLTTH